jgi:hypothetical protein
VVSRKQKLTDCPIQDLRPGQIGWNYDRIEIIADAIVHAAGIVLGP